MVLITRHIFIIIVFCNFPCVSQIINISNLFLGEQTNYQIVLCLGSTSRLDGSTSSRDRSLWSLQQRSISGGGGSAWARSTTTRDSPVLSGLTDGLSSLFSVVEHAGSTESLWRGDGGKILYDGRFIDSKTFFSEDLLNPNPCRFCIFAYFMLNCIINGSSQHLLLNLL